MSRWAVLVICAVLWLWAMVACCVTVCDGMLTGPALFQVPVTVGNLHVNPGDLIMADSGGAILACA